MRSLEVWLHDECIGTLTRERSGKVTFSFDKAWLARADRPILSIAFEQRPNQAPVRKLFMSGTGLPPYFENLLPEGESRKLLAAVHRVKEGDGFGLLEAAGSDLFGAVRVIGPSAQRTESGVTEVGSADSSVEVDFLLAGMQRKLLLTRTDTSRVTARTEDWIIKIPDFTHAGLVRNEYAMMKLAKAAGFDVPDVELTTIRFPRDGQFFSDMPKTMTVLAVRRFDRGPDGARIHAEEVNQMFGLSLPTDKYAFSSEAVAARLKDSGIDPRRVLARFVFHAVIGNGDAHAKNFAVTYPDGRTAELAPIYDAVSTVVYGDGDLALKIGGAKKWGEINMMAFEAFGAKLDIPVDEVRKIVTRTIDATLGAWHEVRDDFPDHLRDLLERHWTQGLTLTRLYIAEHGFPPPLPRIPDHPEGTHTVKRTPEASIVRNRDGFVDNPIDAAIVDRQGNEKFKLGGRDVPREMILGQKAKPSP